MPETNTDNLVKILFRFYSDLLEEETVETMWASIVDELKGFYKLDNIPFYVPGVASDDIVFAEYDEYEERLTYRKTIEHSGNSTVQVVILKNNVDANDIRKLFTDLGCESEKVNDVLFSMEIPANISYTPAKTKLEELKGTGVIDYAEPCLLHEY